MKEKILIISGSELSNGVGEQFLSSMVKAYPQDLIYRYVLSSTLNEEERMHNGIKTYIRKVSHSPIPFLASITHNRYKKNVLPHFANEIGKLIEELGVTCIWLILNSDQVILLGAQLIALKTKIICQVWDTPEYLCEANRLSSPIQKNVLLAFDKVMQYSSHLVCISDYMATVYGSKYQKKTSIMYFTSLETFQPKIRQPKNSNEQIKIVFAGSLYAWKEWNAFVKAIEVYNDSEIHKIEVTLIGSPSRWAKIPKWVNKINHLPSNEAFNKVSAADIAYLPYWMDQKHVETVKMAFPSKMAFYCTASTPIFYHGPTDSSPANFLKHHIVGITCSSVEKSVILENIKLLVKEGFLNNYNGMIEKTYIAFFKEDTSSIIFNKIFSCQ